MGLEITPAGGALPQPLATTDSPTFAGLTVPTINGVKVYRALLTQSGTDAPVATVLENTLGGELVWTYPGSAGAYRATLAGVFTADKVWFNSGSIGVSSILAHFTFVYDNANRITLITGETASGVLADSLLLGTPVEILIYS